jgi:hypothetical protein
MKKRIFTLMTAALLMAGSVFSSAYAAPAAKSAVEYATSSATPIALANGVQFYLGTGAAALYKVDPVKVENKDYVTLNATLNGTVADAAVFEVRNYSNTAAGVTFELWVNGKQVIMKGANVATTSDKLADLNTLFAVAYTSADDKGKINFNALHTATTPSVEVKAGLKTFTSQEGLEADELNEYNANSITLSFDVENLEGNVFNALKPVTLTQNVLGTSPAGTYFVSGKAADVAAFIADAKEATAKKVSFATVKNEQYKIDALQAGEGYKLVMTSGADFYKTTDAADFANAAFTTITAIDQLNDEGKIKLAMSPKIGATPAATAVEVCAIKASDTDTKSYVTTIISGTKFTPIYATLGANSYIDASALLKKNEKSVYNIYFTSNVPSVEGGTLTEYHKYLTVTADDNHTAYQLSALPADDVDLALPQAQWVVSDFDGKYEFTFTNREATSTANVSTLTLKLQPTDNEGEYEIVSGSGSIVGGVTGPIDLTVTTVKFIPVASTSKTDGFLNLSADEMKAGVMLSFEGKNASVGENTYYAAAGTGLLVPSLDASKAAVLSIAKSKGKMDGAGSDVENYIINKVDYAYINDNGELSVKSNGDTLAIPGYKLSYGDDKIKGLLTLDATTASEYFFKKQLDGTYVMTVFGSTPAYTDVAADSKAFGVKTTATPAFGADPYLYAPEEGDFAAVTVLLNDNSDKTTLPAEPRHASFDNKLGSVAMQLNANGIYEGILNNEGVIFWLDTADSKAITPSFYISQGIASENEEVSAERMFMYYAKDSMSIYNEGGAIVKENKNYLLEGTNDSPKAIFRLASLTGVDTLATTVEGKAVNVVKEVKKAGEVTGLNNFKFGICLADEDVEGEYKIYSKADASKYLYSVNGKLGFGTEDQAMVFTLGDEVPTSNDAIEVSEVKVMAGEGQIQIAGAQGKKVVVSNILGQVIANTVVASDNAAIAAPAGVVVVAVEGEAAVKAIVK